MINTDKLLAKSLSIKAGIKPNSQVISEWPKDDGGFLGELVIINSDTISEIINSRNSIALVFASAKNPGGGVLRGSRAQEEVICSASNVFPVIKKEHMFYSYNKYSASREYSDSAIFVKNVTFFYDQFGNRINDHTSDLLFCPAPNRDLVTKDVASKAYERRVKNIVSFASERKYDTLILGEWGTGVFGNDPLDLVLAIKKALKTSGFNLKKIIFTVYSRSNLEAYLYLFKEKNV
jgi:uncharacterized protein (TIGR02452 family)